MKKIAVIIIIIGLVVGKVVAQNQDSAGIPFKDQNRGFLKNQSGSEQTPFSLDQNHPNPVAQNTNISFKLDQSAMVNLKLFDLLGNELMALMNGKMKPGEYNIPIDVSGLNAGIYFYRLVVNGQSETKKLTIKK